MIEEGKSACFMKDKKGYLPAHVACSRHCSPAKLRMLLSVNPGSLHARTFTGQTLLSLATTTATKSHPNFALMDALNHLVRAGVSEDAFAPFGAPTSSEDSDGSTRGRLDSNDTVDTLPFTMPIKPEPSPLTRKRKYSEDMPSVETPAPPAKDVALLLHFSRVNKEEFATQMSLDEEMGVPSRIAEV